MTAWNLQPAGVHGELIIQAFNQWPNYEFARYRPRCSAPGKILMNCWRTSPKASIACGRVPLMKSCSTSTPEIRRSMIQMLEAFRTAEGHGYFSALGGGYGLVSLAPAKVTGTKTGTKSVGMCWMLRALVGHCSLDSRPHCC